MRKLIIYAAASLNGKIAKSDGDISWLNEIPAPEDSDHGFAEFYDSIDTTIQGFTTYKQVLGWDIEFPYKGKNNYVFTRNTSHKNTEFVTMVSADHISFVKYLKQQAGKNIWLIGGGQINTMLLNEKLVDEIRIFIMPVVLNKGIELFEKVPKETKLELIESESYSNGAVQIKYSVLNSQK
jgi:dihydrofolate reductase